MSVDKHILELETEIRELHEQAGGYVPSAEEEAKFERLNTECKQAASVLRDAETSLLSHSTYLKKMEQEHQILTIKIQSKESAVEEIKKLTADGTDSA